jgi:hypothetical protein
MLEPLPSTRQVKRGKTAAMTAPAALTFALIGGLLSSATVGAATPPAFTKLKALVGDWEAKTERGTLIRVSYRLIAGDSVLVQRFITPSGETETVFHPDRSRVIATHYCAQGNQPRLRLDAGSTDTRFVFTFLDATNLENPTSSHLVRLELQLAGADDYTETETYDDGGKPDVTTLKFHRKRVP